MKKKLLAIVSVICALVCSLSLAACGKTDGPTTTGTLNKDENGNVIFEDVEFKLMSVVSGTDKAQFLEIIDSFNKSHRGEINVVVDTLYNDTFDETVQGQIKNRMNPPDLIMSHSSGHLNYLDNKLIQPFDETMELSGITVDMSNYAQGFSKYSSLGVDGKLYSIPSDAQSTIILYNKTLLSKYSETVPSTRAEWLDVSNKAKTGEGKEPILMSTTDGSTRDYIFPTAYLQNGGTMYASDNHAEWSSNATNQDAMKKAIASIRDLATNGLMQKGQSKEAVSAKFVADEAVFYIVTPWEVSEIISNYAKSHNKTVAQVKADDIGAMSTSKMFAMGDNANSANAEKIFCDSHGFMMSTTATDINKKAAILEFIKWFTETGSIGASWAEAGHISLSNTINNDATYKQNDFVNNYISKFYPNIAKLEGLGNTPLANTMTSCFGQILTDALKNNTDTSDATIIAEQEKKYNEAYDFSKM